MVMIIIHFLHTLTLKEKEFILCFLKILWDYITGMGMVTKLGILLSERLRQIRGRVQFH